MKFTSYNHIYSRMNLVVKTSGGYYFAHYIHFTRYGMHAYIELGFYPGGILRGEVLFFIAILCFYDFGISLEGKEFSFRPKEA